MHAYAGITWFGKTDLIFVTGTTGATSSFIDVDKKQGRGVGAAEYGNVLRKALLPNAQHLF